MSAPNFYTPEALIENAGRVKRGLSDGRWVESRPEGLWGLCLRTRIRAAWLVFTGRADVLQWIDQPPRATHQGDTK